jgi:hypothetical protein
MKSALAWLVLLFAVLVPATAAVMVPVFSPAISATKQAQLGSKAHASKAEAKHTVAKGTAHTTRVAKASSDRKHAAGDSTNETCSDCGPCSLCTACGPASSMVAAYGGPLLPRNAADQLASEPVNGRPQFISGGQYRPPRSA